MMTRFNSKLDHCLAELKAHDLDDDIVAYGDKIKNLLASDEELSRVSDVLQERLEAIRKQKTIYSDWLTENQTTGWTHEKARQNISYRNKEACLQTFIDVIEEINQAIKQRLSEMDQAYLRRLIVP